MRFDSKLSNPNGSLVEIAKSYGIQVPDEFICPITLDVMMHPVMTVKGMVYERSAILQWIQDRSNYCPLTRTHLSIRDLVSYGVLENKIAKWKFEYCLEDYCVQKDESNIIFLDVSSSNEELFEKIFQEAEKKNPSSITVIDPRLSIALRC